VNGAVTLIGPPAPTAVTSPVAPTAATAVFAESQPSGIAPTIVVPVAFFTTGDSCCV
jgi:hypothetical protein